MTQFLAVKNYEKHQHYKDRDPVWIKFYVAVLSDPVLARLSEPAQCQLFKFWLLASRHSNRIPFTTAKDKSVVKAAVAPTAKLRLEELLAQGLLERIETNASKSLDESYGLNARVAEEVRGKRLEQDKNPSTTGREPVWTEGEIAVFAAMTESQQRRAKPIFANWREGLGLKGGRPADDLDISAGLLEYIADHDQPTFKAAHMAGYVSKARDRRLRGDGPERPGRGGSFLEVA